MRLLNSATPSEAVREVARKWNDTEWWTETFNSHVAGRIQRIFEADSGTAVVKEDWDTLIILDACRFDLFKSAHERGLTPAGTLESRISRGSGSPEFIRRNFGGNDTFEDIVYITANPFIQKLLDDPFHQIEHVWMNGWDEDDETVRAETMVERTLEVHERFPHKRIISHWMQPHHPFVGDTRLKSDRGFADDMVDSNSGEDGDVVWELLRKGKLKRDAVWGAYRDNLDYALENVRRLVKSLDHKTVLTSDHGNAFGERNRPFPTRVYGHPDRIRIPELVKVPWFIVEHDNRRTIKAETAAGSDQNKVNSDIEDRLEALGYR